MRGLRRTERFETDKPSNRNLKRKQRGNAKAERQSGRTECSHCEAKPETGEKKNRKLSTKVEPEHGNRRNGRGNDGDERNRRAPKEPLSGENGKKGKERAES